MRECRSKLVFVCVAFWSSGVQCAVVAMAPQLHELFEKVKLIRKRLKLKGRLVDFPPGKHDEGEAESQENPISTQSMAMNVPALKVMFEFYRVTSGKNVPVQKFEAQATCPLKSEAGLVSFFIVCLGQSL